MSTKKDWENLLKFATKNKKNRKQAILKATEFISLLTTVGDKKLSEKDLEKIAGGWNLWERLGFKKAKIRYDDTWGD